MKFAVGLKTDGVSMLVTVMKLFDVEDKDEILPCANFARKRAGDRKRFGPFFISI